MQRLLLIISAAVIFSPLCSETTWEQMDNGVIMRLKSEITDVPELIRIEVLDEGIYTIMRAMVMDFGSEPAVRSIGDQYQQH